MATHKIVSPLALESEVAGQAGIVSRYNHFVDQQKPNAIAWWLGSLMIHGCLLVPVTFLLVYTLGGPVMPFLFVSMILFFINVVANMGGAAFRFTFSTFMVSIVIHAVMVLSTILMNL